MCSEKLWFVRIHSSSVGLSSLGSSQVLRSYPLQGRLRHAQTLEPRLGRTAVDLGPYGERQTLDRTEFESKGLEEKDVKDPEAVQFSPQGLGHER